MSVNWGDAAQGHAEVRDQQTTTEPAIDPSSAWGQLAESFPEWSLEPPLVLAPRRPPSS